MQLKHVLWVALALAQASSFAKGPAIPNAPAPVTAVQYVPIVPKADAVLAVSADRPNWTYALGDKALVNIRFNIQPYPAQGVRITYKVGPEQREGAEKEAVVPAEGLLLPVVSPEKPGFVRCIVTATVDGKPVREVITVGFSPEKIVPTQLDAPDFEAYWSQQRADLAKIPPDYQLTPAPELSTDKVAVSYLSFQTVGNYQGHSRFFGVLAVPRGAGPFPALLEYPGAGVRPYKGNIRLAERGMITLQMGVHGIPVNLPPAVYDNLNRGALKDYNNFNLDDPYNFYYRRVHLGALRAADFVTTLPQWDKKNLVTHGYSQGGMISIMVAALDPRVSALAVYHPAYSDVTGYLRASTGGWPGLFKLKADGKPVEAALDAKVRTTTLYDTVNFARRLKVPGLYVWGYNDNVTPPTSTFAVYNTVTAPKQLLIQPELAHRGSVPTSAESNAWILRQVGLMP